MQNNDMSSFVGRQEQDNTGGVVNLEIDNLSQLAEYAKPNCKKCYGRGYRGFMHPNGSDRDMPILCSCVKNIPRKQE